jgi:hypothetical protein
MPQTELASANQLRLLAGQEHGQTIPLADTERHCSQRHLASVISNPSGKAAS